MKKILLLFVMMSVTFACWSQVEVTKFKFARDEPFGNFPGRKMIDIGFKNCSDKDIKYINFYYFAINPVGDVITGTHSDIKLKKLECTGPFEPKKKYSRWGSGVIWTRIKGVKPVPYKIEIIYMGTNEVVELYITKENYKDYFPKYKWIDYSVEGTPGQVY